MSIILSVENAAVLAFMARAIHKICQEHNVTSPFGDENIDPTAMNRAQPPLPDADVLPENVICMPEWRAFIHSLIAHEVVIFNISSISIYPIFPIFCLN